MVLEINDFFIIHIISILIGHLNHSNIHIDYGPLKYLFNNPRMHIWHHAKYLPEGRENGVKFWIEPKSLDYIFNTAYIPKDGKHISLGFENIEKFPKSFLKQFFYPFSKEP